MPDILSNESFRVKTNALLDNGSDSTLVCQDTVEKLALKGENRKLQKSNVFKTQTKHLSKLVKFNISSDMYPNSITFSHSWVVPHLDLPKSEILLNIHDWPTLETSKYQQTTMT